VPCSRSEKASDCRDIGERATVTGKTHQGLVTVGRGAKRKANARPGSRSSELVISVVGVFFGVLVRGVLLRVLWREAGDGGCADARGSG
jgi:hypothetical protein